MMICSTVSETSVFAIFVVLARTIGTALASPGDRSVPYQRCLGQCVRDTCTGSTLAKFYEKQPLFNWVLQWSCPDDCRYKCMWSTTDLLISNGHPVQQFHGKWPFVRWMGLQEPGAAIFSVLNLIVHIQGLWQFRKHVPSNAPNYFLVHLYALVSVNAWVWSTIFHSRDTPLTERMDYSCAFMVVVCSLLLLGIRLLGSYSRWYVAICSGVCLFLLLQHLFYLHWIQFDYGYNMKVNLAIGTLNGILWIQWWLFNRHHLPHAWKSAAFVGLIAASMILELFDFPPIAWVLDSHALWHFATAPLPLLWYSFLTDDCMFLFKKIEALRFHKEL